MIPGLGRSSGEGNGNPLQYSCLENPTDRAAWWAAIRGGGRVSHDRATSTTTADGAQEAKSSLPVLPSLCLPF